MRYYLFLLLFLSCSHPLENTNFLAAPEILEARFEILGTRRSTVATDGLFFIFIDYSIENTGNVDISSYEVFFVVDMGEFGKATESHLGKFVGVGNTRKLRIIFSEFFIVNSVNITDWQLNK